MLLSFDIIFLYIFCFQEEERDEDMKELEERIMGKFAKQKTHSIALKAKVDSLETMVQQILTLTKKKQGSTTASSGAGRTKKAGQRQDDTTQEDETEA